MGQRSWLNWKIWWSKWAMQTGLSFYSSTTMRTQLGLGGLPLASWRNLPRSGGSWHQMPANFTLAQRVLHTWFQKAWHHSSKGESSRMSLGLACPSHSTFMTPLCFGSLSSLLLAGRRELQMGLWLLHKIFRQESLQRRSFSVDTSYKKRKRKERM